MGALDFETEEYVMEWCLKRSVVGQEATVKI
jgi:hypothetical protein